MNGAIAREIQDKRLIPVEVEGVWAVRDLYLITDPDDSPRAWSMRFSILLMNGDAMPEDWNRLSMDSLKCAG